MTNMIFKSYILKRSDFVCFCLCELIEELASHQCFPQNYWKAR